jgi:hypothetical protein
MPFEITIEKIEPERLFSFRWQQMGVDSAEPTTLVVFELDEVEGRHHADDNRVRFRSNSAGTAGEGPSPRTRAGGAWR